MNVSSESVSPEYKEHHYFKVSTFQISQHRHKTMNKFHTVKWMMHNLNKDFVHTVAVLAMVAIELCKKVIEIVLVCNPIILLMQRMWK